MSLSTMQTFVAPQPETFSWPFCLATRWYVLQVIALVFAITIRKVKVKGLDDSKYIVVATYVTSFVLAVTIVATYSLKDFVNVFPPLFCTGFLIGTTVILGLVFVPKVGGLRSL